LATLATVLASAGASVKDVEHDRQFGPRDVSSVEVSFVLETRDRQHIEEISGALKAAGVTHRVE
jgi:threonine dehydratase